MFIRKLILIALILSISIGYTQNLVPNSSFENYIQCPDSTNFGSIDLCLNSWSDPTNGSSDYYNVCSLIPFFSVPLHNNGFGYQYPRTGNGMAGLITYQGLFQTREYIHIQLLDSLKQDSCYYMEFYVNKMNLTNYATNIGCYISNSTINNNNGSIVLNFSPQIEQINAINLTDTLNWTRINGTYKANGGEQYITIGNFSNNTTIDTLTVIGGGTNAAFYYLDDFILKLIPNNISPANAGNNQTIIQGDSIQIGNNPLSDAVYSWYPSVGLNDTTLENPMAKPTVTTTYYCIKDACNNQTIDSVTVTITPNSVNEFYNNTNISLYPNPNNGTFTIEYSKSKEALTLTIISIVGKIVYSETLNSEALVTQITTEKLKTGIYLISISNQNGSIIYNNKINIIK